MSSKPRAFNREREVRRTRKLLERAHSPRLAMMFIIALTGAAGFMASYCMLHLGMLRMWLRLPLAIVLAYAVFLGLLWIWLRSVHQANATQDDGLADTIDAATDLTHSSYSPRDDSDADADLGSSSGSGGSGAADLLPDGGDEAALLVVAIAAIVAVVVALFAVFSIVAAAPVLLAELAVDAALAGGLYRLARSIDLQQHWLATAFRRTVWKFAAMAALFGIVGAVTQMLDPSANSLADLLR